MKITLTKQLSRCDLFVLPVFKDKCFPSKELKNLNRNTQVLIKEALKNVSFKGELGEIHLVQTANDKATKICLLSLGEKKELSSEFVRRAFGKVAKHSKSFKNVTLDLTDLPWQAALEGFILGRYKFTQYFTKKPEDKTEKLTLIGVSAKEQNEIIKVERTCEAITYVRDLVNDPDHEVTPLYLVSEVRALAKQYTSLKATILDMQDLKKLGLGGLVAIGCGSMHEPHLAILEYSPQNAKNKKPLLIVGKGITFDTGGLNLKPSGHIETMKLDMAGAATVLALAKLNAQLRVPHKIVYLLPLAENGIGDKATKPGSIVKMYNGQTVEIVNMDAEGRMILADALAYGIKKYNPERAIDIATLTGAAMVALGYEITPVLGTDQKLIDLYLEAAKQADEKAWSLPLDQDYVKMLKGKISDLMNQNKNNRAETISATGFLSYFVGKTPWIHIDIAATAWAMNDSDYRTEGGTGEGVKTLFNLIQKL